MAGAYIYGNALDKALNGEVNAGSDDFKCALMAASYTPDRLADADWSDISSHEAAGSGYTADGLLLTGVSSSLTAADSWGQGWVNSAATPFQQIVVPTSVNGFVYLAVVAGTTGASEPTWPTVIGDTVTDGSVVWLCAGTAVEVLTSNQPEWNPITIDTAFAVIYDSTSGALLSYQDFGGTQSLTAADLTVDNAGPQGWYYQIVI